MKKLFLICIMLLFVGCATQQNLYVDSQPVLPNVFSFKSVKNDLSGVFKFENSKDMVMKGEKVSIPEAMVPGKTYVFKPGVDSPYLAVSFTNPKEVYFEVVEQYIIWYAGQEEPYSVARRILKSSLNTRSMTVRLPFGPEILRVQYEAKVLDESRETLMLLGEITYVNGERGGASNVK